MGFDTFNKRVQSKLAVNGQSDASVTRDGDTKKNIYPARVVSIEDPFEMNRIVVEIVNINSEGVETPGEDRMIKRSDLPFCIPMIPAYINLQVEISDLVWVLVENPRDMTSVRYWMGPIVSTKTNLSGQNFKSAHEIFDRTETNLNQRLENSPAYSVLPQRSDVALLGKNDAVVSLRNREVFLSAGQFVNKQNDFALNVLTPLMLQLKQFDSDVDNPKAFNYSQANLQATSINIYSTLGKFRDPKDGKTYEPANTDLEKLDDLSKSLHPSVLGDELLKLMSLLIQLVLTHKHTPQASLAPNALSKELSQYTIDGKLQDLLSKYVRIN
jgi:hypothetical protein